VAVVEARLHLPPGRDVPDEADLRADSGARSVRSKGELTRVSTHVPAEYHRRMCAGSSGLLCQHPDNLPQLNHQKLNQGGTRQSAGQCKESYHRSTHKANV